MRRNNTKSAINLTDEPISLPEQDKLGIAPIAENLATIIRKMDAPTGVAFGINGSWGIGKTSLIKLVEHYLQEDIREKSIKVINFHCWWFNSEEALILNFLQTLHASLDDELKEKTKEVIIAKLKSLAPLKSLAQAALNITTGGVAQPLTSLLDSFFNAEENKNMDSLFQNLSEGLKEEKKRYLIIIDDIDRLSAAEMTMIFRLVKTLGHLPNVVYLLAFDRAPAEQALKRIYPDVGAHFLEKIIQSSINIPLPKDEVLKSLVFDEAEHIFGYSTKPGTNFIQRWDAQHAIELICFAYIQTPRDFKRYKNALRTTYPAVKGKVYTPDYLAIEAFRIFEPELHAYIESKYSLLISPLILDRIPRRESDTWESFRDGCKSQIRDEISDKRKDAIQSIILYLFSGTDALVKIASRKGLAAPAHFRTYFYWSAEEIPSRGIPF